MSAVSAGRIRLCIRFIVNLTCNKNAFQWDTYHPLVDSLPRGGVSAGGCLPGECLPGGVCPGGVCPGGSAQVVSAQGGVCLGVCPGGGGFCPEGVCQGGVSARVGVCPGGVCPGGLSATPPLWTDRHLWKQNLRKFRLRAVKKKKQTNLPLRFSRPS